MKSSDTTIAPRPWKVRRYSRAHSAYVVTDKNGRFVVIATEKIARMIVRAVHFRDKHANSSGGEA